MIIKLHLMSRHLVRISVLWVGLLGMVIRLLMLIICHLVVGKFLRRNCTSRIKIIVIVARSICRVCMSLATCHVAATICPPTLTLMIVIELLLHNIWAKLITSIVGQI